MRGVILIGCVWWMFYLMLLGGGYFGCVVGDGDGYVVIDGLVVFLVGLVV